MFKKSLSVLLAVVMVMSVFAALPVTSSAQSLDVVEVSANLDVAETGNPYPDWNGNYPGNDSNCTWTAWQRAHDEAGVTLPGWGNAWTWYSSAQKAGYATGSTPRAKSIVVFSQQSWNGWYGHVAYVSDYNPSTGKIYKKEGNYNGAYHEGWAPAYEDSMLGYIYLDSGNNDKVGPSYDDFHVGEIQSSQFTVMAHVTDPSGIREVKYAVWTSNNGQDELKWYTGHCTDGNDYYWCHVPFSEHKNEKGVYIVHMYAYDNAGNLTQPGISYNFDSNGPSYTDFHVGELREGAFTILAKVTDINGVASVRYAVWTENNGQDDLIWYDGHCTDGNDYYWARVNFADHKGETGKYIIHMYAYDVAGKLTQSGITYSFNAGMDVNFWVDGKDQINIDGIGTIQVYVDGQLQKYGGNSSYTDFCQNVAVGKPYEVRVNITDSNYHFAGADTYESGYSGQTGTTRSEGTLVRLAIVKNTGGLTSIPDGNYQIVSAIDNTYGLDIAGDDRPAKNTDNVILWGVGSTPRPQDCFTITYLGNGYYSIKQMGTDMAVDVQSGTSDRLNNIMMCESHNGNNQQWKIKYDNEIGGYTIQSKCSGMYMTVYGENLFAGTNVYQDIYYAVKAQGWNFVRINENEAPVISNVQISDVSPAGYTVTCDVSDDFAIDKVSFPTWTIDNDQDDLFDDWVLTAVGTVADGKATYRVNTSDHGGQAGCVYLTHIYAFDYAGNNTSVGQNIYPVLAVEVPSPISNVRVYNVDETGFTVSCDIDISWGNITKVEFPTWTEDNGQDDLVWHAGTLTNGKAFCRINTSDHGNALSGIYITHIYLYGENNTLTYDGDWDHTCLKFDYEKALNREIDDPTQPAEQLFILGDADGDGKVTILDATTIQRHLASLPTTAYHETQGDADEDGKVTILDATAIQRHLASLPTNKRIGTLI